MYNTFTNSTPRLADDRNQRSIIWPPARYRKTQVALLIFDYLSRPDEDYVPMQGHGCRSWQDGSWD